MPTAKVTPLYKLCTNDRVLNNKRCPMLANVKHHMLSVRVNRAQAAIKGWHITRSLEHGGETLKGGEGGVGRLFKPPRLSGYSGSISRYLRALRGRVML